MRWRVKAPRILRRGERRFSAGPLGRKRVYALKGEKAKESIPAKGGEKRCSAMGVGSQL
jgi:hypothetical protein